MKQVQLLSLFVIALILISNQGVQSSLTKSKTKTNIQSKSMTENKSKALTQTKAKTSSMSHSQTQSKATSKSKSKTKSKQIDFENFNLPGFSSNAISDVIKESQQEDEMQENYTPQRIQKPLVDLSNDGGSYENENQFNGLNMLETKESVEKPYIKNGKFEYQNWFSIASIQLGNNKKFPEVNTSGDSFHIDFKNKDFRRINPLFKRGKGIPNKYFFWFRLNKVYLWYTFNKKEINIVGRIQVKNIYDLRFYEKKRGKKHVDYCFNPIEKTKESWSICSKNKKEVTKWFCKLIKLTKLSKNDLCDPKKYKGSAKSNVMIKTVTQPIIIIPTASRTCNVGWSYAKKGTDWECLCKEGLEQSPVDLPPISKGIDTDAKPVFEYNRVEVKMTSDYAPAKINSGDNNVIRYEHEALRIKHPNFGKIVTLDGAVYFAQEIVFHTPSEHTINGKKFDMEMQIIHYGKSVGDTLKSVILSFLFKATPGSFNKFIDKLDFFDLPNPINKARELSKALFIPEILQDSNDENVNFMLPFSFYTYQGSHTAPPCAEKTIHYVASEPIGLSNTNLEMFKESLRVPDMMDSKGNVHVSDSVLENNRGTQPLNGRPIFHYDHTNFNCPTFRKAKQGGNKKKGHYEKIPKETVEYFYVNGPKPSGIPNAFVVTDKEALGSLYKEKKTKGKKKKGKK